MTTNKQDGVTLLRAHHFLPTLNVADESSKREPLELVYFERFRSAVPLLPILRPHHGILIARTRVASGATNVFK